MPLPLPLPRLVSLLPLRLPPLLLLPLLLVPLPPPVLLLLLHCDCSYHCRHYCSDPQCHHYGCSSTTATTVTTATMTNTTATTGTTSRPPPSRMLPPLPLLSPGCWDQGSLSLQECPIYWGSPCSRTALWAWVGGSQEGVAAAAVGETPSWS